MIRPTNLTDCYSWEITFTDGAIITQIRNNTKPKGQRIDANDPPDDHGPALRICLTPIKDPVNARFHRVDVWIPEGAKPVYAGRTPMTGDIPTGFEYLVGYAIDGRRHLRVIDYKTGSERQDTDADPRSR
jgi:hypothetical protein